MNKEVFEPTVVDIIEINCEDVIAESVPEGDEF